MMSFLSYLILTYKKNKGLYGLSVFKHRKIYIEWKHINQSKKTPLDLELPWVTVIAKNYIENFLKTKSKPEVNVFEYGSGGSSLFFLKYSSQVVSIEHNEEWFELVNKTVKQKNIKGWEGHLIEPEPIINGFQIKLDASDPLHFYTKSTDFLNCTFKNYASFIDKFPDKYFDIVMVDGRSRPSCLYHSLNKIKQGGLLILDNAEREYYLSKNIIDTNVFSLTISINSALISNNQFTQTNIYIKKF
jgi:hypothetical protein